MWTKRLVSRQSLSAEFALARFANRNSLLFLPRPRFLPSIDPDYNEKDSDQNQLEGSILNKRAWSRGVCYRIQREDNILVRRVLVAEDEVVGAVYCRYKREVVVRDVRFRESNCSRISMMPLREIARIHNIEANFTSTFNLN